MVTQMEAITSLSQLVAKNMTEMEEVRKKMEGMEKGREEEGKGHRGKGMWPSSAETFSLDPGGERH